MHERNRDFPNFWSALLIIGLLIGVETIIAGGFYDAGISFSSGDPKASVISVLGAGVVLSLLMSYKKFGYRQLFPSGRPPSVLGLVLPILTLSFGSVVMATEVDNLLLQVFPQSASEIEQDMELFSGGVVSVITLCLIAPFIEEMVFRGVFLRSFLHLYSPRRAIVLSALLFGLAHLNIYQFVVASTLGLLSGWLYYATGSLWPAILEHAVYNGGVYSYARMTAGDQQTVLAEAMPVHSTSVLIFALATFSVGLWWLFKAVKPIADAKTGSA
jgi:membrane protease YdiL (CAAX protease family)